MNSTTLASEWEEFQRVFSPSITDQEREDHRVSFFSGGMSAITIVAEAIGELNKLDALAPTNRLQLARLIGELQEFTREMVEETIGE